MEIDKFIKFGIAAVICVITFSALLVPIVADAQVNNGDEITLTNTTQAVYRAIEDGDVLNTYLETVDNMSVQHLILNDDEVTTVSDGGLTWNLGLMSDGVCLIINSANYSSLGVIYNMSLENPTPVYINNSSNIKITATDSNLIVTNGDTTVMTVRYTWGYVCCNLEDGQYCAAVSGGTGYVNSEAEVILGGAYTTGNNDTMYYYKNGNLVLSNSAYTGDVNLTKTLHEGTTDIYDVTVSVSVGDETFTPYRCLLPYEVSGHATSGAVYNMLGLIPIVVLAGLIISCALFAIRSRYE